LYPCGDTARLAQALCWMIDHPEQRAEFGKRGAELAQSQSMQATAKAFLSAARFSVDTKNSRRR